MKKVMVLTTAAMLLLVPLPARADTESYHLAKLRAPVGQAVKKALAFLAKRLGSDETFAREVKGMNAVAGLAGMAFLSAGHTPGRGPYGDVVNRCIDYITAQAVSKKDGRQAGGWRYLTTPKGYLSGYRMYGHGIATLFLCEVSGMVDPKRQKKLDVLLPKALKVILDAQAIQKEARYAGGWRYKPDSPDSDLSVSGWCLMALRSARLNGAPVPAEAIKKAIGYVNRCNGTYQGGGGMSPAMAGVSLLCRELAGHHNDAMNRRYGNYLRGWAMGTFGPHARPPTDRLEYSTYYASLGMFQLGGKYWEEFAVPLYSYLIKHQRKDGGWYAGAAGPVYTTSVYTLSLTPSYCQLPIYQR